MFRDELQLLATSKSSWHAGCHQKLAESCVGTGTDRLGVAPVPEV